MNGIVTGDKEPSKPLVRLFEFVLLSEKPEALKGSVHVREEPLQKLPRRETVSSADFDELIAKMAELDEHERADLIDHFKGLAELVSNKGKMKKY